MEQTFHQEHFSNNKTDSNISTMKMTSNYFFLQRAVLILFIHQIH